MASTSKVEKQPNWTAAAKQAAKKLTRKLQKLTAAEKGKSTDILAVFLLFLLFPLVKVPQVAVLAGRLRLLKEN